ncbi:MAG: hypothetical protein HY842_15440 [Bacteroidetes bacterium]|nr:hypothetical protein [Bacteroidota bacterium]
MNNEINNDPLEEFFQRHLDGYAENPPAEALANIRQRMAPRRSKNWQRLAWVGLLVFAGSALGGAAFWANRQSQRIAALERQLAASKTLHDQKEVATTPAPITGVSDSLFSSNGSPGTPVEPSSPERTGDHFFTQKKQVPRAKTDGKASSGEQSDFLSKSIDNQQFTNDESPTQTTVIELESEVPRLASLDLLAHSGLRFLPKKNAPLAATKVTEMPPTRHFAGEVYAGYALWHGANGLGEGTRWQTGVLATLVDRARWSFSLGVEYGQYALESSSETSVAWDESNLSTGPQGNLTAHYTYINRWNFGENLLAATVQYLPQNDSLDLLAEDFLNLSTTARTKAELLTMPFILRLNLGKGRLHWHLKGGLGVTNVLNQRTTVEAAVSAVRRPGRYQVVSAEVEKEFRSLESVFFQGYAGCGVSWQLDRQHSLLLESVSSFALTPIFDDAGQETKPWALGLQVGVRRGL